MAEEHKKDVEQKVEKKVVKSSKPEAHISKYKKNVVKDIIKLMKEYPIVGAVNMENMPAGSLAKMRGQLREQCIIKMAKRRVMKYAFEEVAEDKKGIKDLIPHLKGMPALLFTKENPFSLFKFIKNKKSAAPAKAGQEAPIDIVVNAGPTPFVPGPVISELGAIGLKTKVVDGKIHIIENKVVAKEGEEISGPLAGMLLRLGIEPMEIGLDLVAVYEDGIIYDKKVLNIDEEEFMNNLQNASRWAFNLAVEVGHYTPATVNILIPKAFRESKSVALEAKIMNDVTKEEILAQAEAQALSLKKEANIDTSAAKPAKVKEAAPVEDKVEQTQQGSSEAETKEEVKKEEKPAEEVKAEAPKEEDKVEQTQQGSSKAETKDTANEEIKKEAEEEAKKADVEELDNTLSPKAEEKKEDKAPTREEIKKEEEEIKEEIKDIKEKVEEEKKDPKSVDIKELQEEVKEVEEKLEKVEEEKAQLPPTEKIIIQKKEPETKERVIDPEKKKAAEEGAALFEQLKKEGTLRNVDKKEDIKKSSEPKSPQEIIAEAHKKMGN